MRFRSTYKKPVLFFLILSIFLTFSLINIDNKDLYFSFPRKMSNLVLLIYTILILVLYGLSRVGAFIVINENIVIRYPYSWMKKPYIISKNNVQDFIFDMDKEFFLIDSDRGLIEVDCKAWKFDSGEQKESIRMAIMNKLISWEIEKLNADFFDVEKYKQRFFTNHVNLVFFIGLTIILQAITWQYSCYILPSVQTLDKLVIVLSIMIASLTLLFYGYREKDGRIFDGGYFSILALPVIFSLCCAYAIPKYTVFNGHAKEYVYTLVSSNENQQLWQSQGTDDLQIKHKYNYDYRDETIGTQRTVVIYQGWGDIKVIKESTVNSFFQK